MKPAVLLKILLVMSMISAVSAFADSFFILFFPNLHVVVDP